MKFISWNVNGLRACVTKGFLDFFKEVDADIFCLQETKLQEGQIDLNLEGYYDYWNYAQKKGYSGTAIFTKKKPISVAYGIDIEEHDNEGRVITLEFENFYYIACYVPNAGEELKRLSFRLEFESDLVKYLNKLNSIKPIIYAGDLNVAHKEIDLKNPKQNTRSAGFTIEERNAFTQLLDNGYTDTFRYLYPEKIQYTWWSYRFKAREKNIGWRIDYFVVSNSIKDKIRDMIIHNEILGSDHCPIELLIEM